MIIILPGILDAAPVAQLDECTRCGNSYADPREELQVCPRCTRTLQRSERSIVGTEEHSNACPVVTCTLVDGLLACTCEPSTWDDDEDDADAEALDEDGEPLPISAVTAELVAHLEEHHHAEPSEISDTYVRELHDMLHESPSDHAHPSCARCGTGPSRAYGDDVPADHVDQVCADCIAERAAEVSG